MEATDIQEEVTQPELLPSLPPEGYFKHIDTADLELGVGPEPTPQLIASIRTLGVLQPVLAIVRLYGTEPPYRVVDGRRRTKAAIAAGETFVPCFVLPEGSALPDVLQLASHALRSKNMAAEIAAIEELIARHATDRMIADATGLTLGEIRARLPLLQLPPEFRAALDAGTIAASVAKRIAGLPYPTQQRLADRLAENGKITASDVKEERQARSQQAVVDLGLDDLVAGAPEYTPPPSVSWQALMARVEEAHDAVKATTRQALLRDLLNDMTNWAQQGATVISEKEENPDA
jgi:ParB/RepB/Spo0J family partition protein